MKKILMISLATLLVSTAVFADGMNSKSKKHYAGGAAKPSVEAKSKAGDSERAKSGFYVGAGAGWFDAANEFKAHEPEDGTQFSYVKKKPKGDPAVVPNILVGYRFNEYFSADINAQYRKFKYEAIRDLDGGINKFKQQFNQEVKNYSLFLNANLGVPTGTLFTPYVTAGIGYARNSGDLASVVTNLNTGKVDPDLGFKSPGKKTNNFAWNAGLGAKVKVNKNFDLDLSYRYLDLGKVRVDKTSFSGDADSVVSATSQHLKAHQVLLNLIYNI